MFLFLLILNVFNPTFIQDLSPPKIVVGKVLILGNKKTKEYIIARELDLKSGDTLQEAEMADRLEKNRRKIFNLNLFLTTKAEFLPTANPVVYDVQITVKEQWYIFPFPIFIIADRNLNEWWTEKNGDLSRTTLGLALRHKNFRGRAEEIKINVGLGFTNFYDFFYRIPYIDKAQKTGLTYGISYSNDRNLRYNTSSDKLLDLRTDNLLRNRFYSNVVLRRRNKFYDFQFLELRYNYNRIADTVAKLNPTYFLNQQTKQRFFQVGYNYTYDFRDKVQYPLRGHFFSVQVNKLGLLPSDNVNTFDLTITLAKYHALSQRWFVSLQGKTRLSAPNKQAFLQTRGFGYGTDFVRGYELYVIDGQRLGYLKTNLRYQALDKVFDIKRYLKMSQFNTLPLAIYPNIFLDFGYVANQFANTNNSKLANKMLMGYGIDLDFVSWYNGVFRLGYVFNKEGQSGLRYSFGREF